MYFYSICVDDEPRAVTFAKVYWYVSRFASGVAVIDDWLEFVAVVWLAKSIEPIDSEC